MILDIAKITFEYYLIVVVDNFVYSVQCERQRNKIIIVIMDEPNGYRLLSFWGWVDVKSMGRVHGRMKSTPYVPDYSSFAYVRGARSPKSVNVGSSFSFCCFPSSLPATEFGRGGFASVEGSAAGHQNAVFFEIGAVVHRENVLEVLLVVP